MAERDPWDVSEVLSEESPAPETTASADDEWGVAEVVEQPRGFSAPTEGKDTWLETFDGGRDVGRAGTATGQFIRGFGNVVSSVPKSVALAQAGDKGLAATVMSAMDRIDAGERIDAPGQSLEIQRAWSSYIIPYQNSSPEQRQAMRQQWQTVETEATPDPREHPAYQFGQRIDKTVTGLKRVNPEYAEEFWAGKVPQGVGSTFAFLLAGPAGVSGVAGAGAMAGSVEGFEDATNKGAPLDQALSSSGWNALVGTSEAAPIISILNRLDRSSGGMVKRAIINMVKSGTEEAVQEGFQQVAGNLIASDVVGYDPDREWYSGAGENAGVGFTAGALMDFLYTVAAGGRRGGITRQPSPSAPTEAAANDPWGVSEIAPDERIEPTMGTEQAPAPQIPTVSQTTDLPIAPQTETTITPENEPVPMVNLGKLGEKIPPNLPNVEAPISSVIPPQIPTAAIPREKAGTRPSRNAFIDLLTSSGGMSREEAEAQGIDPAYFKDFKGKNPLFPKQGGMTFDEAAELISQHGYGAEDYSANELLDMLDRSLRGETVMPARARTTEKDLAASAGLDQYLATQEAAQARELVRQARSPKPVTESDLGASTAEMPEYSDEDLIAGQVFEESEYDPAMTGEARALFELHQDAKQYDEATADGIIESQKPPSEIARGLFQIIQEGKKRGRPAAEPRAPAGAQEQRPAAQAPAVEPRAVEPPAAEEGFRLEPQQVRPATGAAAPAPDTGDLFGAAPSPTQQAINRARAERDPTGPYVPPSAGPGELFAGPRPEQLDITRPERRHDTEQRKRVAEMSLDETRRALLLDDLTGLPNRRAYEESEKKAVQVFLDMDSLKWINDNLGHDSGDQILRTFGEILRTAAGNDAYHLSGDEFIIQADTVDAADAFMHVVHTTSEAVTLEFQAPDGKRINLTGLGFSYGYGEPHHGQEGPAYRLAEIQAANNKTERENLGLRAKRGEPPAQVSEKPAVRDEAVTRAPAEETETADRPAEVGKGVTRTGLTVEFNGRRYPVDSFKDASEKWDKFRKKTGAGASEIGDAMLIYDQDGKVVAHVSYNGKVWPGRPEDWTSDTNPLYGEKWAPPISRDEWETPSMAVDTKSGEVTIGMGAAKIDESAHESATSPQNKLPEPTEAQDDLVDEAVNDKVSVLVNALNDAGFRTTMSGDLYGNELVYVDLDAKAAQQAAKATLPEPWILTSKWTPITYRDVLGRPIPKKQEGMVENIMQSELGRISRIARKGGAVTTEEAERIVAAIQSTKPAGAEPRGALADTATKKTPISTKVVPKTTEPVAEGQAQAKESPSKPTASKLDAHDKLFDKVYEGTATVEEFKQHLEDVVSQEQAITDELSGLTKDAILKRLGGMSAHRYKSENKARVVGQAYQSMLNDFTLGESLSFMVGDNYRQSQLNAIRKIVENATTETLSKFAENIKAARGERKQRAEAMVEAVKDPKTLDDFETFLRVKKRADLDQEQRERYDELRAEKSRGERKARKTEERTTVRAAGATTGAEIIATKHTQKGYDLFVVKAAERVERDVYNAWNAAAKKLGGWYSSYNKGGAVPGFQFKTRESAEAFQKYVSGGDTEAVKEVAQARRDAFADDRSQTAVERLREMADRLDERADESLGQERKENTDRRARMAASAEANANYQKSLAKTMRNVAQAIEDGKAKFLDQARQKVQVEMLNSFVTSAKYRELREKYKDYVEQEKHKGERPTSETVEYAEWPTYSAYRSDLARLGRELLAVDGIKLVGQRLLKVANDITDTYTKFAKENLHLVSRFSTKDGGRPVFPTQDDAENVIARSGHNGKATSIQIKRGQHMIVMSPSEAQRNGIWQGDDDKRITLSPDLGAEIVEKAARLSLRKRVSLPHQFESAAEQRKRLAAMGIETPAEFRSALREFIKYREAPPEADKVKQMERAMIGRRKDGLDFFPTPAEASDQMIEAAGIEEGMSILEPSAGMGHIADRIREAGFDTDVMELSGDRRELLEAKGYNVVGTDFMDVKDVSYDRIIMNPPFSDRRDMQHVQHAYEMLKPGGRLVALMGEGVFFGSDKKATEFREWLERVGGTDEKLEEGTFQDAALPVNTGVNARMVVIDKPSVEEAKFSRVLPQTETPEFKRWFGDSKVVNENGKPLVVYHGTPHGRFDVFSYDGRGTGADQHGFGDYGKGFYFSPDEEVAERYSQIETGTAPRVYVVYLKMEHPLDLRKYNPLRQRSSMTDEEYDFADEFIGTVGDNWQDADTEEQLMSAGYDGIIAQGGREYIVFKPEQIKSAIDNRGTFDPDNPDIRFASTQTPAAGLEASAIDDHIAPILKRLKTKVPVTVVESYEDLPPAVYSKIQEEGIDVQGVAYDGRVYLVASQIPTLDVAERVLLDHELRHIGLRELLGRDLGPVLTKAFYGREHAKIMQFARERGLRTASRTDAMTAAEEYIVNLAETRQENTLLQKVYAAIRDFLRRMGFKIELADVDLRDIVARAGSLIERGKRRVPKGAVTMSQDIESMNEQPVFSTPAPIFYRQMQRVLAEKLPNTGPAMAIRAQIKNMAKSGDFKQEEYDWSGIDQWLADQKGKLTKEQVLDFIRANQAVMQEVELGKAGASEALYQDALEAMRRNDNLGYDHASEALRDAINEDDWSKTWPDVDAKDIPIIQRYVDAEKAAKKTKFETYVLPGGENYRELLLTLPTRSEFDPSKVDFTRKRQSVTQGTVTLKYDGRDLGTWDDSGNIETNYRRPEAELRAMARRLWESGDPKNGITSIAEGFRSSHFAGVPNILAHVRFNERTDADGKRVLFIEEVQSDWHQKGRKDGYKIPNLEQKNFVTWLKDNKIGLPESEIEKQFKTRSGTQVEAWQAEQDVAFGNASRVPDAPFKTTWPLLAMKRMIRYAAENGFDRIAWTTGEQQADRYDLSRHINEVVSTKDGGGYHILVTDKNGITITNRLYNKTDLPDVVGKELADKIIQRSEQNPYQVFTGLDLKVGGEGMKAFYDQMLPSMVNKYVKKWGAKVGTTKIDIGAEYAAVTENNQRVVFTSREAAEKWLDDHGEAGEVEKIEPAKDVDIPSLDITTAMRDSVMQGQPMFARRASGVTGPVTFSDTRTEARYRASRAGMNDPRRLPQRMKEWFAHVGAGFTRHYIDMPNIAEYAKAHEMLRQYEAAPQAAKEKAVGILKEITKDMSPAEYDLFTRKVILDDLAFEDSQQHQLPFGFTSKTLANDKAAVDQAVKASPKVEKALFVRKRFLDRVTDQLVDKGILSADQIKNPAYFRHQVLTYARIWQYTQGSSKLKKPKPGYARKRHGSEEDINANYLEAEFEFLHRALIDVKAADTIEGIQDEYDIKEVLKQKAAVQNKGKPDDQKVTWRDIIPDDYTTWQPDKGNMFFLGQSIGEKAINHILETLATNSPQVPTAELTEVLDGIRSALMVGGKKREMVIPHELAATLDEMRPNVERGFMDHLFSVPLGAWKQWVLINPRRVLRYNLNNLSGDLDAIIAGSPKAVRKLPQAIRELYLIQRGKAVPSARYREAIARGVFDSGLTIQEIPDINYLKKFDNLIRGPKVTEIPGYVALRIWRFLKEYTQFRENWMRYAAYLDYVERLEKGESMESIGYGATNPDIVDQIKDHKDRAALLARDMVGDYGNVSAFGQEIRRKLIPFYSWIEINTGRYLRLIANAYGQGLGKGLGTTATIGTISGARITAWLYVRMAILYLLVQMFNNLVFPDDEEALSPTDRSRLHLLMGKDKDGKIRMLRFQGALSDFLAWFGFDEAVGTIGNIEKGRASWTDVVQVIAKAPVNKVVSGITPLIKTPVELASGKSFYPDVFNPRRIHDKPREMFRLFSLDPEYDWLTGNPMRGYAEQAEGLLFYKRDVGEIAFNQIYELQRNYMRGKGIEGGTDFSTPKSRAIRKLRLAKRYEDKEAAAKAMDELREIGVRPYEVTRAIRSMRPLSGISIRDRNAFMQTLDAKEMQLLNEANEYYRRVYEGG